MLLSLAPRATKLLPSHRPNAVPLLFTNISHTLCHTRNTVLIPWLLFIHPGADVIVPRSKPAPGSSPEPG